MFKRLSQNTTVPMNFADNDVSSFIISAYIFFSISVFVALSSEQFIHWFLIPITISGILIGNDAINWIRGRYTVFDPIGIIGLLGIHFFYFAPLLIIAWDYRILYVLPIDDWRPWLGTMAILNSFGIIIYNVSRNTFFSVLKTSIPRIWQLDIKLFSNIAFLALVITFILQIAIYIQFDGVIGYITSIDTIVNSGVAKFNGFGALFTVSESFPIILFIVFAVYAYRTKSCSSWTMLISIVILFLILRIFFGGLRGSRSATIWALFWIFGIIHLWLRPISRKLVYIGIVFLIAFMYFVGFFKTLGSQLFDVAQSTASIAQLEKQTNRSFQVVAISDLSRADIQAYLLFRLSSRDSDYEYAWGRTYFSGIVSPIPSAIWADKPPTKVKEGTDVLYGRRAYEQGVYRASQIYGLAGEAMLNFTPIVVPFMFIVLGFVVARVRYWLLMWDTDDSRRLLLPFFIIFCFLILVNDMDNNLIYLVQNGLIPVVIIWLSSTKKVILERQRAK